MAAMTTDVLAQRFEEHRPHLRAVAARVLGSPAEAEDAVQEAWLRLVRGEGGGQDGDRADIANLGGWLTTVVARISLNMLRARGTRREELGAELPEGPGTAPGAPAPPASPEEEAVLADALAPALLAVLDTLTPAERLAFVLHDVFDVPFDEIAGVVGRSPAAARQLASRGRRRVRGGGDGSAHAAPDRRREVVRAFLAASRGGDFAGLLALLDPDVELRADATVLAMGGATPARGAEAVAATFSGRAHAARPALVDGMPAAVWATGGRPQVLFEFTVEDGRITAIDLIGDPAVLADLDVEFLRWSTG
jgi:RNA polymerase sigma-70 factor (ECF subfamily)